MAEYLKVVMVEPHKAPYVTEIEDELSALQRLSADILRLLETVTVHLLSVTRKENSKVRGQSQNS